MRSTIRRLCSLSAFIPNSSNFFTVTHWRKFLDPYSIDAFQSLIANKFSTSGTSCSYVNSNVNELTGLPGCNYNAELKDELRR